MEEPAQTLKNSYKQIGAITSTISFAEKSKIAYKIEKVPHKLETSEWTPVVIDYTKLHKHYLKLSKIKLTSMYISISARFVFWIQNIINYN